MVGCKPGVILPAFTTYPKHARDPPFLDGRQYPCADQFRQADLVDLRAEAAWGSFLEYRDLAVATTRAALLRIGSATGVGARVSYLQLSQCRLAPGAM
jgi:hypothetical protein